MLAARGRTNLGDVIRLLAAGTVSGILGRPIGGQ